MSWVEIFTIIVGSVLIVLASGMPVAFALLLISLVGIVITQGFGGPLQQYILSIQTSVSSFTLLPIPLFIFMGEILWQTKVAERALHALDKLLGRVPGRLSLLTIMSGAVFSTLSGSTIANTALLGKLLVPQMLRLGYSGSMSMGAVMGSGGLAMLIPPSALAVIFAAVANVSIGRLLIALIVPGILLAFLYAAFVIITAILRPDMAPPQEVGSVSLGEKLRGVAIYVLPLSIIVFLVIGVILIGVATPTEAAALGCVGSLAVSVAYRGLTMKGLRAALMGTVSVTVMLMTILAAANGFSQLLAYTGASRGVLEFVTSQTQNPMVFVIIVMIFILLLGTFLEEVAMMLITLPILMPIVLALKIDPIWFSVMMLINLQVGLMSPPFGLLLFVMRGVTPPQVSTGAILKSTIPFVVIDVIMIALIIVWPSIATCLPSLVYDVK